MKKLTTLFLSIALSICFAGCMSATDDYGLTAEELSAEAADNCVVFYDFDGSEGDIYEQEEWANELLELNPDATLVVTGRDMRISMPTGHTPVEPTDPMPEGVSKGTECFAPERATDLQSL